MTPLSEMGGYVFWTKRRLQPASNRFVGRKTAKGSFSLGLAPPVWRRSPRCKTRVLGVADELKGQIPLGLLVLKVGVEREHAEICDETVQLVRERVGPVAVFSRRSSGLRSDA